MVRYVPASLAAEFSLWTRWWKEKTDPYSLSSSSVRGHSLRQPAADCLFLHVEEFEKVPLKFAKETIESF